MHIIESNADSCAYISEARAKQNSSLHFFDEIAMAPRLSQSQVPAPEENTSDSLRHDLSKLSKLVSKLLSSDESESGSYDSPSLKRPRSQCQFTPQTKAFLERYDKIFPHKELANGSRSYFVPVCGITTRDLPESKNSDAKYYGALMEITVPPSANNLDQCSFKRGPRRQFSQSEFLYALNTELKGRQDLKAHDGSLAFFTHGCFTPAGVCDTDAVRLAALSGIPTVALDWRSTEGPWYTLPFRYALDFSAAALQEKDFEAALDETFKSIGPERAAMISFSRGAAFNNSYFEHRFTLPERSKLRAGVMAHADLKTSAFDRDQDGLNPITAASRSTFVLGNRHDKALFLGRIRIFGNRVGDAEKSDISAVEKAGGKYLIDEFKLHGGNFNHYVNYRLIAGMLNGLCLRKDASKFPCSGQNPRPSSAAPAYFSPGSYFSP